MSNEEQAAEILECTKCAFRTYPNNCKSCYDKKVVLEMAFIKDKQFETLINSLPESLKQLITDLTI